MKAKSKRKDHALPEGGIVCGTDFSPPASVATDVAAAIARRLGVPLTLAHAVEMPGSIAADEKAVAWLTNNREKVLRQEAARARKKGCEIVPHMEPGRGDEVLVKLASVSKSRLIVIGSLGRRAPEKWLLGSVAERTAERAETPTLVLRAPEGLREWLNGTRTLKVFVCFNFTRTSESRSAG